jgi:hypothetical protein
MYATKYFYALGQSARSRGWTKHQASVYFGIDSAPDFARITFDKGYRGLSI